MQEIQTEFFNWEIPNKPSHNKAIRRIAKMSVYCHEPYASDLLNVYLGEKTSHTESISKDLSSGQVYNCKIVSINENTALGQTVSGQTVYIDLKKDLRDSIKFGISGMDMSIGSEVKAYVRKVNDNYLGSVVESYLQSLRSELFEQIKKETSAYTVKIESINKGGYILDLCGIKCFIPGSLSAANKITDFESYIGKEIPVMVEGYVEAKDIFIVSYKKYLSMIMDQKVQELDLTKKYKGIVTGSKSFGVFVEWESVYTGLIHKSEVDGNEKLISLQTGDEVEFYVKEIKDNNKLTLTLEKPLEKNVILQEISNKIAEGTMETVEATVKHKRKNGILIELDSFGFMGFIPSDKFNKKTRNCKSGDSITVKLIAVDTIAGKIFAEPTDES